MLAPGNQVKEAGDAGRPKTYGKHDVLACSGIP